VEFDANGLEIIDRSECLRLLKTVPIGRIGLSVDALPVVLPVNFVLRNEEIIIRTAPGTKLSAAVANAVVAFEADQFDSISHTGWSVLVQGTSRVLRDPAEIEAARQLPLRPWANEATDWFIALTTDVVNGRRVRSWSRPAAHTAFVHVAGHQADSSDILETMR
jgi:nitroimidazol reductase NimA-like FMN-containing flavoprotein (pyridoxamine 5'-phosphate oxidase superfamily)